MYKKFKRAVKSMLPKTFRRTLANWYHYLESLIANILLGFPGRKLRVIGVTGTSGKSTVTAMIGHIFNELGEPTGYFSTTNAYWGGQERANASTLTTETPMNLYNRVKIVEKAGDKYLIVESSAHAVVQHRLAFLKYRGAAFTNLSHDHLDYFGDMSSYSQAKQKLFSLVAKRKGWGVFNNDDSYSDFMRTPISEDKSLAYSLEDGDLIASEIKEEKGISSFMVSYKEQSQHVEMHLMGRFNIENALCAIGCAIQEGFSFRDSAIAMSSFKGVKGRMERFVSASGAEVLVDFAHTPDAFELVLSDLRKTTKGRIISVFGGYGDRDPTIRAPFGRISATYSDHIILTEDTVGSESVSAINADIKEGISEVETFEGGVEEIEARELAIKRAIDIAQKGDVVALLGKGHEREIKRIPADKPWDEIQTVKDLLKED